MPVTTLDPRTALIVVDLQQGVRDYPTLHPLDEVVRKAAELGAAFRHHGLPVVLVNVSGGAPGRTEQRRAASRRPDDWMDLMPELDRQPEDITVTKTTPGAFSSTDLEARLRSRGVTQVVLAGVSTSNGVEATARHAYELGFNVTLALDAMTDVDAEAHAWSIGRIFPRLGETGSSAQIVALLGAVDAESMPAFAR